VPSLNIPFITFVLGLGVVVMAVVQGGLGTFLGHLAPSGNGLVSLLLWAALAALLANLVNNLPAVLLLLPLAAVSGPLAILAVLIGVNVGPNLTYVGSLATLLWRRIAADHDHEVAIGEFTILGLLTTPASLVAAVASLWVMGTVVLGGA
jgi:arsenical pump membrane protein